LLEMVTLEGKVFFKFFFMARSQVQDKDGRSKA
jgi:hypothetical protein